MIFFHRNANKHFTNAVVFYRLAYTLDNALFLAYVFLSFSLLKIIYMFLMKVVVLNPT